MVHGIYALEMALGNLRMRLDREGGGLAGALKKVLSQPEPPFAEMGAVKVFLEKGTYERQADHAMDALIKLAWRTVLGDLTSLAALANANDIRRAYGDPKSPATVAALDEAMKRGGLLRTRVCYVYSLLACGSCARYQGETAERESTASEACDAAAQGSGSVRVRRGTRGPLGVLIESVGKLMLIDVRERDKTSAPIVTPGRVESPHGRQRTPLPSRKGRLSTG